MWEKVLKLGASLIQNPEQFQTSAAFELLYGNINAVRAEIKAALFQGGERTTPAQKEERALPVSTEVPSPPLLSISEERQKDVVPETEPELETCETVVLSTVQPAFTVIPPVVIPVRVEQNAPDECDDETCETVQLSVGQPVPAHTVSPAIPPAPHQIASEESDESCETVMLTGGQPVRSYAASPAISPPPLQTAAEEIDESCETVVLSGGQSAWNSTRSLVDTLYPMTPGMNQRSDDGDDLTATIVLSGRSVANEIRTAAVPATVIEDSDTSFSENDQLDATIIMPTRPRILPRR
jgi:hypothetical protein